MRLLGFRRKRRCNSCWHEEHERPDIKHYRDKVFVPDYLDLLRKEDPETLKEGERQAVIVVHDETTLSSREGLRVLYQLEGEEHRLRAVLRGDLFMISGFMCKCHGFLWDEATGEKSWRIIHPGKNEDGYWTAKHMMVQVEDVMPIFERFHPGCDIHVFFDSSSGHTAKAPDALNVHNLNLGDGRKAGVEMNMRDTRWTGADGVVHEQPMVNENGEQLGVRSLLTQRGLFEADLLLTCDICTKGKKATKAERLGKHPKCCNSYILSQQPDFLAATESTWLAETGAKLKNAEGQRYVYVHFFPKFHCECNPIELIWAYIKHYFREHCKYSKKFLETELGPFLEKSIPLDYIKNAFLHCAKFIYCYSQKLDGPLLVYAMRRMRGHRTLPTANLLTLLKEQFEVLHASRGDLAAPLADAPAAVGVAQADDLDPPQPQVQQLKKRRTATYDADVDASLEATLSDDIETPTVLDIWKKPKNAEREATLCDVPHRVHQRVLANLVATLVKEKWRDIPKVDEFIEGLDSLESESKRSVLVRKWESLNDDENAEANDVLAWSHVYKRDELHRLLDNSHTCAYVKNKMPRAPPRPHGVAALPVPDVRFIADTVDLGTYRSPYADDSHHAASSASLLYKITARTQQALLAKALRGNVRSAALHDLYDISDVKLYNLAGNTWLDSTITYPFLNLLRADEYQKVVADGSYTPKLILQDVLLQVLHNAHREGTLREEAQKIARTWHHDHNIAVLAHDEIALIANLSNTHWVVVFVYPSMKAIHGLNGFTDDSIRKRILPYVIAWLRAEHDVVSAPFEPNDWTYMDVRSGHKQTDGSSCGWMALVAIWCWKNHIRLDFHQRDNREWRDLIALCLFYGTLVNKATPVKLSGLRSLNSKVAGQVLKLNNNRDLNSAPIDLVDDNDMDVDS